MMTTIPSEILLHLWLAFMLILGVGCIEGCRRLMRQERTARGIRP
ncbi:hypothetical protein [Pseudomonas sp. URMO17WK12:I12]|nr:hypothetical protein [Pseudomonas sp. URMO17WK12:I12]